MIYLAEL